MRLCLRICLRIFLGAFLLTAATNPAYAQVQRERITSFNADITVNTDGSLSIVETIDVYAAGQNIKRGIFRDFPTRSITWLGLNYVAGFTIERIARDGRPEPYFSEELSAGIRTYLGQRNILLRPGFYRYTIAYKTTRQLLFRDGEDELYWNVTGDAWAFPIEKVSVTVRLPGGLKSMRTAGYTGMRGTRGTSFETLPSASGTISMATTRMLAPGQGFTIAVVWPEGAVTRPTMRDNMSALLDANRGPVFGLILFVVLLGYFIIVWRRVGRDPAPGTIIPLFAPPEDLSPVAVGFISAGGFKGGFSASQAFTVGLTSLATKRIVTISETDGREITLRTGDTPPDDLPRGEQAIFSSLFGDGAGNRTGGDQITFGKKYTPGIAAARDALIAAFGKEYAGLYVQKNRRQWIVGAAIALTAVFATLLGDSAGDGGLATTAFLLVFAAGFAAPTFVMMSRVFPQLRTSLRSRNVGGVIAALLVLAMSAGFLIPVFLVVGMMINIVSPATLIVAALPIIATYCFWFWLSAPTRLGRAVLDGIEGYRMYLSVAEADRLNAAGRDPEITEALFEKHLPYAMALGVEDEWTDKFDAWLDAAATAPGQSKSAYRPSWYSSRNAARWKGPSSLTRGLSRGLRSAASTASTRPSSSSGGGGTSSSGSSGGGGGGGGGGGW